MQNVRSRPCDSSYENGQLNLLLHNISISGHFYLLYDSNDASDGSKDLLVTSCLLDPDEKETMIIERKEERN